MMRTPETAMIFARDIEACRNMQGHDKAFIDRIVDDERAYQAEYDRRFDDMLAQVRAIKSPADRDHICKLLVKLGGDGCLSGTLEFVATNRALRLYGVTHASAIYEHDRSVIAEMCATAEET
jgi:hypothetical protein